MGLVKIFFEIKLPEVRILILTHIFNIDKISHKVYTIPSSFKFYGGVLDSTDVGCLHCKSEMCQASVSRHKRVHSERVDAREGTGGGGPET